MKKVYIFIAFLLCLLPSFGAAGQTISLRVMSMNIKEGASYASNESKPYADLIMEYDPDFVCLQEVDGSQQVQEYGELVIDYDAGVV